MKDLESRAIGMALIYKDAAERLVKELQGVDIIWNDDRNRKVFEQIVFLVNHKAPVDILTVCARLKKIGQSVQVTTMYVAELTKCVAGYNAQEMTEFINSVNNN